MAEINEYLHFAGPMRRDKALHTLIGLLRGITADGAISEAERRELRDWLSIHSSLQRKCSGFAELAGATEKAIADGVITTEEQADLIALCNRLESHSEYFGATTHVIQELQGRLHGVIADGVVTEAEIVGLLEWVSEYEGVRSNWPVTEIESLLVHVLSDRTVTAAEQAELIAFFAEFTDLSTDSPVQRQIQLAPKHLTIRGICAADPEIIVPGHAFCFTGLSRRATKAECREAVGRRGGSSRETVTNDLDYLVICADGNPCWAYSCYGRKVEEAMWRRRDRGQNILLVHESDFWDALN